MIIQDKTRGQVIFVCDCLPDARQIYLAGNFNDWNPKARRMVKVRDGSFRARLDLAPGDYQYKFVADDLWLEDQFADTRVPNQYGTFNSIVRVLP